MIHRETERLVLRNFTPLDLEDMLKITLQYEASEMGQYDQPYPQTAETMQPLLGFLSSGDEFAAVELKSENKLIGLIQIQQKKDYTEIVVRGFGFIFNSDYHGQGYAVEACNEALKYLFEDLKIDKVVAGTAAVNDRSRHLLGKLGFHQVGEKTTHFRKDVDGKPIEFLYSLYERST